MILDDDSPLRRLPAGLDPAQRLVLDGIRLTTHMAGLAYTRLVQAALDVGAHDDNGGEASASAIPTLLADAWSVVDHINRLRALVQVIPGARESQPILEFVNNTQGILDLRDTVQHLPERIPGMVASQQPALGTLTWVYRPDPSLSVVWVYHATPGTVAGGSSVQMKVVNLASTMRAQVDHLTLSSWQPARRATGTGLAAHVNPNTAGVTPVSLSDAIRHAHELVAIPLS